MAEKSRKQLRLRCCTIVVCLVAAPALSMPVANAAPLISLSTVPATEANVNGDPGTIDGRDVDERLETDGDHRRPLWGQVPPPIPVCSNSNNANYAPSISADGRFIAFSSEANNLGPVDINPFVDVYVHDTLTGSTELVSISSLGIQGNDESEYPSISADGRYVVFDSYASNLVVGDTNLAWDVFIHDRLTKTTERLSVSSSDEEGNDWSAWSRVSDGGRFVAFQSQASNIVAGDTNEVRDIFVWDRLLGTTERVSVSSSGTQGNHTSRGRPDISADGRFVTFTSRATNLVPGVTNPREDVFVRDRLTADTELVSVSSSGAQSNHWSFNSSISSDGRFVGLQSFANNLVPNDTNESVDAFIRDRNAGLTELVSVNSLGEQGNDSSYAPVVSGDGQFVVYDSYANNLVPNDTNLSFDVFGRDRGTGTTERVSLRSSGSQTFNGAGNVDPDMTPDGRYVVFTSWAYDLAPSDTDDFPDVYVRDRELGVTEHISQGHCQLEGS